VETKLSKINITTKREALTKGFRYNLREAYLLLYQITLTKDLTRE